MTKLDAFPPDVALDALLRALEAAGVGCTVIVDRAGALERAYMNEPAARIFGRDARSMQDVPPMVRLTAAERDRLAEMHASGREPPTLQTSIVREDGASTPVEVGLATVPIGEVRGTFVFIRDVSAKAAVEAELRASEERFRSLAEASPDSITIVAGDRFTYANPAALQQMGLSSFHQLDGVDPMSLTPPAQREAAVALVERLRSGEPVSFEVRALAPDGREKLFEASMRQTTIRGEPAVVSFTRDLTERVMLQAELTTRDRLAAVGTLAAGVAHELNNPLAALSMQARSLREEADGLALPEDVKARLALIDEAADRMRSIVGDLLFMARPVDKVQSHVDVRKILESTIALVRAGGVKLPVSVELDPLPPIQGFASKLGQVFVNLLRNAAEAVEGDAKGTIRVRGHADDDAIVLVFEDDGPGIPKELLAEVTRPFFTTKPQGVGLGLWISQSLVADHGGTLEIASDAGAGTKVTLRLPLASPESR